MNNINAIIGYLYSLHEVKPSCNDLTNPKLQRLLYLIQGHSLLMLKKPAFTEKIIAYQSGPVVEEVYDTFRRFVDFPIVLPSGYFDCNNLDSDIKSIIDFIFQEYAIYSSWYLRKIIKTQSPYIDAKNNSEISHESLQAFFATKHD